MENNGDIQTSDAARSELPRLEDIPMTPHGLDPMSVAAAFETFERQLARRPADAPVPALVEDNGDVLRQDAMRLIRAAVEFADIVERDAQDIATRRMTHIEVETQRLKEALRARESAVTAREQEIERQKASLLTVAQREADEIVAAAQREASRVRHDAAAFIEAARREAAHIKREAEDAGLSVAELSRQQAAEVAQASRADVERTLDWARVQADSILSRARAIAEQLLGAAASGEDVSRVVEAIVADAEAAAPQPEPPAEETPAPALTAPVADMIIPTVESDGRPRHLPPSLAER